MASADGGWYRVKFTFLGGQPVPLEGNIRTMKWRHVADEPRVMVSQKLSGAKQE